MLARPVKTRVREVRIGRSKGCIAARGWWCSYGLHAYHRVLYVYTTVLKKGLAPPVRVAGSGLRRVTRRRPAVIGVNVSHILTFTRNDYREHLDTHTSLPLPR